MLNGLDLFSGIGGNSLALASWINTVAYCEQDRHAQAVLLSRMRDGLLPSRPIWDDVSTLRGQDLPGIDIIVGGFPCQDISVAGKGAGLERGERSGLFFQIVRLAKEVQPAFLFLENVPAIRTRGLDIVIQELTALGYDLRWTMLSAEEVGAPHKRNRWFCLAAHSERIQLRLEQGRSCGPYGQGTSKPRIDGEEKRLANTRGFGRGQECSISGRSVEGMSAQGRSAGSSNSGQVMADSGGPCFGRERDANLERSGNSEERRNSPGHGFSDSNETGERSSSVGSATGIFDEAWWAVEPDVGRVAHGLSGSVDRLRRLGNAVVPLQAREAFKELMGIKE